MLSMMHASAEQPALLTERNAQYDGLHIVFVSYSGSYQPRLKVGVWVENPVSLHGRYSI
jgi:hypothetical protein